ncbi:MAG: uroporphyrinogen-III synthase [Xanthomonadales bacterium]|nr:uroporphyrinogen-III synthase [Xanthomonadales bacterium]
MNLKGTPILVTRPEPEARGMASLVHASNGFPIVQPGISIECCEDEATLAELDRLSTYRSAIFTSPNAVRCALARKARRDWPSELGFYAVGQTTRRALLMAGFPEVTAPEEGGSEALLAAVPAADFGDTLILAARGGRTLLADAIGEAGHRVAWSYVYRRGPPERSEQAARQLNSQWGRVIVIAASAEILKNVSEMFDGLTTRPLVVPSARLREEARAMGFAYVAVSRRPDDRSLLETATRFID